MENNLLGFGCRSAGALAHLLLETTTLALGEATPDTEALVVREGVFEALVADRARLADALGFAGGAALFREESVRISLCAQGLILPFLLYCAEQAVKAEPFYKGIPLAIVNVRRTFSARQGGVFHGFYLSILGGLHTVSGFPVSLLGDRESLGLQ